MIKTFIRKTFAKKGEKVINMNPSLFRALQRHMIKLFDDMIEELH